MSISSEIKNAAYRTYNSTLGIDEVIEVVARMAADQARAELIAAFRPLVTACDREFTSEETAGEPDESPVLLPCDDRPAHLTFGVIRRARRAIADLHRPLTEETEQP